MEYFVQKPIPKFYAPHRTARYTVSNFKRFRNSTRNFLVISLAPVHTLSVCLCSRQSQELFRRWPFPILEVFIIVILLFLFCFRLFLMKCFFVLFAQVRKKLENEKKKSKESNLATSFFRHLSESGVFRQCMYYWCDFREVSGVISPATQKKSSMSDENKTTPYRRPGNDLEAGNSRRDYPEDDDNGSGPFDIVRTKSAPVHRLRRWRVSLSHCFLPTPFVILW